MTLEQFKLTLKEQHPPEGISNLLRAMWHEGNNDWDTAHNIAQDISSADAAWVHAYLHRKEGDRGNAAYWYRLAGRPVPSVSLDEEWEQITAELLA